MIVRDRLGRREAFALFDSSTPIPRPSEWGGNLSHAGERITFEGAVGLPAFLRGVRLICESAAPLPLGVYRGFDEAKRPVKNAPQLALLRRPNTDMTALAFWQYVYASLIRHNAYIRKIKVNGRLVAMYPVNPDTVTPKYEGSRPTFEIREYLDGRSHTETLTKDQIIHIPGITLIDPYVGVSVVAASRHALGTDLGRQRFEGRYLANDARPGVVLKHPGQPVKDQRDEIRTSFESRHQGNPGRPAMMWGGWDLDQLTVSLQDAQFIEAKRFSIQDIGRMLGIPSGLLNDPDAPAGDSPEHENIRLLQHGVRPWIDRVEGGLTADMDLFPDVEQYVEADERGFLRADTKTRYEAYRLGRQGGWLTGNEPRRWEGLEPRPGGDELQQTPVGGESNPGQASEPGKQAADE